MTLSTLYKIFSDHNCNKIYVKYLSPNDNSKNQVYVGESFEILNILPVSDIVPDNSGSWERIRYKSRLDFYWTDEHGILSEAPEAKLILYPNYPEVRLSGFLSGVKNGPSEIMTSRIKNRLLFLGITSDNRIISYVTLPDSEVFNEFDSVKDLTSTGVFKEVILQNGIVQLNTKDRLLSELLRIHNSGWLDAKRLDKSGLIIPCSSSNCGGYTLEAELGIIPNGYSEPDYLGWEVKQFSVDNFQKIESPIITLMTPEPTQGIYVDKGLEFFIRTYGYSDKRGREARINFGGRHFFDKPEKTTGLKLMVNGFDPSSLKISDSNGFIGLIDKDENVAAAWGFPSLLKHWNRKHANAAYVPSMIRKDEILFQFSKQQYCYGNNIRLCEGTSFSYFLQHIVTGNIYYDPGIKLELEIPDIRKQKTKRRSQFRIKSSNIPLLYNSTENTILM